MVSVGLYFREQPKTSVALDPLIVDRHNGSVRLDNTPSRAKSLALILLSSHFSRKSIQVKPHTQPAPKLRHRHPQLTTPSPNIDEHVSQQRGPLYRPDILHYLFRHYTRCVLASRRRGLGRGKSTSRHQPSFLPRLPWPIHTPRRWCKFARQGRWLFCCYWQEAKAIRSRKRRKCRQIVETSRR